MSTPVQDHESTPPAARQSGRHPVNVGHLVMGVAFLGLAGIWCLYDGDVVHTDEVHWLLPVPWVLAGLAGLIAIGLSSSKRWSARQTGWVAPAVPTETAGAEPDQRDEPTDESTEDPTDNPTDNPTDDPTQEK